MHARYSKNIVESLEKTGFGNQEWTIQIRWQHRAHKTHDEDKQNKAQQTEAQHKTPPKTGGEPMGMRAKVASKAQKPINLKCIVTQSLTFSYFSTDIKFCPVGQLLCACKNTLYP